MQVTLFGRTTMQAVLQNSEEKHTLILYALFLVSARLEFKKCYGYVVLARNLCRLKLSQTLITFCPSFTLIMESRQTLTLSYGN